MRGEPPPHLGDDLRLRVLALVDRQRLAEEMDVGRRAAVGRHADRRLDLRDPFDALQLLEQLERDLARALERRAFGRVDVDRPLAHVLVRHELAADHAVERERQQRRDDRDADDDPGMIERPVDAPRVPPVQPVEEAALLASSDRPPRPRASGTASSASASA